MKVAILGFGREGKSLFAFLKKSPAWRKSEFWILDQNQKLVAPRDVRHALGTGYLKNISSFDIVFRSPGIPFTLPQLQAARKKGVVISSATKLFFEEIRKIKSRRGGKPLIIGVTGTKGKGTTCTLLFQILKRAGRRALLAGNIGKPMLDILPRARRADIIILELSSFQLQDLKASPDVSVILDMFPDHLDAHKNLREYYEAKTAIGFFQKKADAIFYFTTNPLSRRIALKSPARKFGIRPAENNLRKNFDIAAAIARHLRVSKSIIQKTITSFKGTEHRLEFVRSLGNVSFWNDSAGTNPIAAIAAIRSFKEPIVLIAGGKDKGFDYRPLGPAVRKSSVAAVVLIGENKNKIEKVLRVSKKPVIKTTTLSQAVRAAFRLAREAIHDSGKAVVLLSPASASFDMFKNYADRGERFKKLVRGLQ